MAKRVDPLKAKAAKQKKIAIGGVVLLLALLAFQGPKTMKMLQGPQPIAQPNATAPPTTPGTPTAPAQPTGTPAPPTGGEELASVADSDAAPEPVEGQLATFERFATKDPFVQQALPDPGPSRTSDANDGAASDAGADAAANGGGDDDPSAGSGDETGGFTSGGSTPAEPAVAGATSIAVNGAAEDVAIEGAFPKEEPTFVLVSVAKNGKSVQIGIAGGEYAGGKDTMTLAFGKKVTLQNTADGSRYELELESVQGFPIPKSKK